MAEVKHYSATRAKKSLGHFAIGKVASAALSATFLALTVRYTPVVDYGSYIVLLAALDIFYLTTGLGLSTVAQRYVAEFRTKASASRLNRFLTHLSCRRLAYSLLAALLLLLIQIAFGSLFALPLTGTSYYLALLLLIASASGFFLDEILGSLLHQGLFQTLSVGKIIARLAAVGYCIHRDGTLGITQLLLIECSVSWAATLIGHLLLWLSLRAEGAAGPGDPAYDNPGMWQTAFRFYVVQLFGQIYGPNVSRVLISRLLGLAQTAVFGFAQSVADMLRNFMPAHLLAGWIRPLMISRYLARRSMSDLADVANLVLKLNLLGIIPLGVFFLLRGDAFGIWLSKGQYPAAGHLLTLLTIMIGLQTAHLLFAMVTITLEQPNANIAATVAAALSLPLSLLLISQFGAAGAACGLLSSEAIWLVTASVLLARRQFHIDWDLRGTLKLLSAGLLSGIILYLSGFGAPHPADLLISALILGSAFLLCSILVKPLRPPERALVSEILPARFVVW